MLLSWAVTVHGWLLEPAAAGDGEDADLTVWRSPSGRSVRYGTVCQSKTHKSEHWKARYTVVGVEAVEVPAGKFNAIKVEAEGQWTAELEPMQTVVQEAQATADSTTLVTAAQRSRSEPTTGRTYKAFWYAPEIRRWVKSVAEYYSSGGVRSERFTQELES